MFPLGRIPNQDVPVMRLEHSITAERFHYKDIWLKYPVNDGYKAKISGLHYTRKFIFHCMITTFLKAVCIYNMISYKEWAKYGFLFLCLSFHM